MALAWGAWFAGVGVADVRTAVVVRTFAVGNIG